MKSLLVISLVLLSIYGYWTINYPSGSFRYKLTLVVDDNGKQVIGSAVREVTIQINPLITPEMTNSVSVKGEAVVVDLGEKGILFALLRSDQNVDYGYQIAFNAFAPNKPATRQGLEYLTQLKEAKKQLSFDKLPMLVRFRDINDPKTVEKIDPNDLERTFGSGVKLVSVTIEITNEPVTSRINYIISKNAWKEHGYAKWKMSLPYGHPLRFGFEDFQRNF